MHLVPVQREAHQRLQRRRLVRRKIEGGADVIRIYLGDLVAAADRAADAGDRAGRVGRSAAPREAGPRPPGGPDWSRDGHRGPRRRARAHDAAVRTVARLLVPRLLEARIALVPTTAVVAPGQGADLVLLDGDPVADPAAYGRVVLVVRGGRVVWQSQPF